MIERYGEGPFKVAYKIFKANTVLLWEPGGIEKICELIKEKVPEKFDGSPQAEIRVYEFVDICNLYMTFEGKY